MRRPGLHKLSARRVAALTRPGRYGDGGGLVLVVRRRGGPLERLWVFRYSRGPRGAQRESTVSLGPAGDVSLTLARELAGRCRAALAAGEDPRRALGPHRGATFGEVRLGRPHGLEDREHGRAGA